MTEVKLDERVRGTEFVPNSQNQKGPSVEEQILETEIYEQLVAVLNAINETQEKNAREDAEQSEEIIAKADETADVLASFKKAQVSHQSAQVVPVTGHTATPVSISPQATPVSTGASAGASAAAVSNA